MTSWIVAIDKNYPQHWEIAAERGFWDMTKGMRIEGGDPVYFWRSGKGLISRTVATSSYRALRPEDAPPWEDSGKRTYTHRFTFRVVSQARVDNPSWGELQNAPGVRSSPHFGPNRVTDADGEAWLAARFERAPIPDVHVDENLLIKIEALLGHDLRKRAIAEIAMRQGQSDFRNALLDAYVSTCAVTGCRTQAVLEAAHISPYLGAHTNLVMNGLLLRADIHTLFDRLLLTVTPDLIIRVSPDLEDLEYQELNGRRLAPLPPSALRPSSAALKTHNASCAWLGARSSRHPSVE